MLNAESLREIVVGKQKLEKAIPHPDLTVKSYEDGLRIWNHRDVKSFFNEKSMNWKPQRECSVFLPCSATKPYPISPSHKRGYLKALFPALDKIDIFVISEPMGVVPYYFSDEYPVKDYDYDPSRFFKGKEEEYCA